MLTHGGRCAEAVDMWICTLEEQEAVERRPIGRGDCEQAVQDAACAETYRLP